MDFEGFQFSNKYRIFLFKVHRTWLFFNIFMIMRIVMKFNLFLKFMFVTLLFIGCGDEKPADESAANEYATETITVETIKCQMCVATVQRAALQVTGVEGIRIDFDRKIATVSFNSDLTSLQDIELAIAKSGFHANDTRRDEEVYATLPDCCK
jgi:copper chaperone CopZ